MGRPPIDRGPRTGHNSAPERSLRALRVQRHENASVQEQVAFPTAEVLRAYIAEGKCPFCGLVFKLLPGHTHRAHGISAAELKQAAGIPKTKPACSEEFSQVKRENSRASHPAEVMAQLRAAQRHGPRDFSAAGRQAQADKLRAYWEERNPGKPWNEASRAAAVVARRQQAQPRYDEIVARLQGGELAIDIAEDMNVSLPVVKRARQQAGLGDGRGSPQLRELKARNWQPKGNEGYVRAMAAQREARLARWRELGADWPAVATLVEEWGVSRKTVLTYLREAGEVIADGRAHSPLLYRHPPSTRICEICGATPHVAKGLCDRHYRAWRKSGLAIEDYREIH